LREPFAPDAPVTRAELRAVLAALGAGADAVPWEQDSSGADAPMDQAVTRGEACRLIAAIRD
jgi:hypothetical protein